MKRALLHIIPLLMLTPSVAVAQTNDYKVTSGMKPDAMPKPLRPEHHNPHPAPSLINLSMQKPLPQILFR